MTRNRTTPIKFHSFCVFEIFAFDQSPILTHSHERFIYFLYLEYIKTVLRHSMNNILSKIKLVMAVRLSFRKLRITLSSAALVRSRMDRPELEIRHITDFLWPEVK